MSASTNTSNLTLDESKGHESSSDSGRNEQTAAERFSFSMTNRELSNGGSVTGARRRRLDSPPEIIQVVEHSHCSARVAERAAPSERSVHPIGFERTRLITEALSTASATGAPIIHPGNRAFSFYPYRTNPWYYPEQPRFPMDPFGAIIFTRPRYSHDRRELYNIYTFNPQIVSEWANSHLLSQAAENFKAQTFGLHSTSKSRVMTHVYGFSILNTKLRDSSEAEKKNLTTTGWYEPNSSNDIYVQTAAWTS